jgi:hypothetical protein
MNVERQKQSQYHAEVTPTTGPHLISLHIIDRSLGMRSFSQWDKAMDINHENKTSCSTQYQ